jgi:spore coat polysaccharide biosynthesis predicted glycosyltransferase SpsG
MSHPTEVLVDVQDMARLMTSSDLVIGAGGSSSWERCCLGVPSLMFVLAENQKANAQDLQAAGAVRVLSNCTELPEILCRLSSPHGTSELQAMSKAAAALTDGLGAMRVSDWMWSQHG